MNSVLFQNLFIIFETINSQITMIAKIKKIFYTGIQYLTTQKVSDQYIAWLSFANAGMLHKGNVFCMDYAIKNLPSDNPILEIGSFCGLSTNVISYLLAKHSKTNKIISADKWIFEGSETGAKLGNSTISHQDYREYIKETFKRNVEFFSKNNKPYTIEVFSDEFFDLWKKKTKVNDVFDREIELGGKFSFCYVDGNHTYEYTKRDFENINKNLDIGGYILFDDSADTDPFGLTKLMKEIQNNKNYKLIMKNPNYLFIKIA